MTEHQSPQCDAFLSAAFGILGKRWNGVILGMLAQSDAGFAELSRGMDGAISDSVLSTRLHELTELGLLTRLVLPGPPVAVRYSLTEAGQALIPALDALGSWARGHLSTALVPAAESVPGAD
jgi:DNA-binding HxlR family transcriptional regulator